MKIAARIVLVLFGLLCIAMHQCSDWHRDCDYTNSIERCLRTANCVTTPAELNRLMYARVTRCPVKDHL